MPFGKLASVAKSVGGAAGLLPGADGDQGNSASADDSPPNEVSEALSLWARHSSHAAVRGALAAAYARSQADIARSLAQRASTLLGDIVQQDPCVGALKGGMPQEAVPEEAGVVPPLAALLGAALLPPSTRVPLAALRSWRPLSRPLACSFL
mmetsp:Transcript_55748/g.154303  ORF Transcript_55748/g.154303 Transcript_55748/m.154303 type:complete len:152 (-) Transcript_55748:226-681(-)